MCVYRLPCWLRGKESAGSAGDTGEAGSGRSLEEGMATHASIPAWNIPWTEEPGGPRSISVAESDLSEATHTRMCIYTCLCKVQVLLFQLSSTFCDHVDCTQPGSSVHRILQARILEWVAMLSSRESSQPRDGTQVSLIVDRFFTI